MLSSVCCRKPLHYSDVIMTTMVSQLTSLTVVYSIVYSDADQRKYQSSASLAFVRGIHREPVNCPHKGPVTRKKFPFGDVIMITSFVLSGNEIRPTWVKINPNLCRHVTSQGHNELNTHRFYLSDSIFHKLCEHYCCALISFVSIIFCGGFMWICQHVRHSHSAGTGKFVSPTPLKYSWRIWLTSPDI